jgi:hypothetical protein
VDCAKAQGGGVSERGRQLSQVLVVLIGRNRGAAVLKHLDAFASNAGTLREQLGIDARIVEVTGIDFAAHEIRAWQPEVAILVPTYTDSAEKVIEVCDQIRRQPGAPRVVYFDTYDQTSSPHLSVIAHVDRYLKSKKLVDNAGYGLAYEGGNPLSQFAKATYACDLTGWNFGSDLPEAHADKLRACWSFGVSRDFVRIQRAADKYAPKWRSRFFDVNRRIGLLASDERATHWYAVLRRKSADAMHEASKGLRGTGDARVSRRRYLLELFASKIVFSPFGWGEVCFRDYEAAAAGCLLIKPDMGHLRTSPDIFRDGQTYVSVRWDLADLGEKIRHYLEKPEEGERIAAAGAAVLREYSTRGGFARDVAGALQGLVPSAQGATGRTEWSAA